MCIPRQGCKTCDSPHADFINERLLAGAEYPAILRALKARGDSSLSTNNLSVHKRNHLVREDPALEQTIRELEQEAAMAPPTVASVYHVLIGQLRMLENARPSAETAIKAAEAISRITGMRTQQALLIAYAERAFSQGASPSIPAPRAELVRPGEAS